MDDRTIMRERRDFTLIFDNIKNCFINFDWSLKLCPENCFTGIELSSFPIFQNNGIDMDDITIMRERRNFTLIFDNIKNFFHF